VKIGFKDTPSPEPSGYILRRKQFDNILIEKIRGIPIISFMEDFKVAEISRNNGGFSISREGETEKLSCKMIILASGGNSGKLMKDLQLPESLGNTNPGIGIRTYFNGVKDLEPDHKIEMHFCKELLPWYLWIFPTGESTANVGLGLLYNDMKSKDLSMKELLFDVLKTNKSLAYRFEKAGPVEKISAERLQYYTGQKKIASDGILLTGDAACLIDPFTGEGIANALISGFYAADTAADCYKTGDYSINRTATYQENLYNKIGGELDLGLRLQNKAHNAFLINLVVNKARKNKSVRELLAKMVYNINTMGELTSPMFYLKLALNL
jgi:flavin-dependent dehydrogenase